MNVLFDLDGTLTDPGEGFVACVSHALAKLGCRPCTKDEIRRHVGPPLEETLARLLEDRAQIPAAVAHYRERYSTIGFLENAVYPGMEDALGALHARDLRLFVATSKPTVYAQRILEHFGLRRFFRGVYGSELDGTRSGKTELLAYLMKQERLSTGMMIGDRAQDIAGALANGLTPVGALWGYGSREELEKAGAVHLCPCPSQLPQLVPQLGSVPGPSRV